VARHGVTAISRASDGKFPHRGCGRIAASARRPSAAGRRLARQTGPSRHLRERTAVRPRKARAWTKA